MHRSMFLLGALVLSCTLPRLACAAPPALEDVDALVSASKFEEAEQLAREVLAGRESNASADELGVADALDALVVTLMRAEKAKEPETRRLAERAVEIRERLQGSDHVDFANSLVHLAEVLCVSAVYDTARTDYERSLEILRKTYGPEHDSVLSAMSGLANVLGSLEDYPALLELSEEALALHERVSGPSSPAVAAALAELGPVLLRLGRYERAKASHERELAIFEQAEGPEGPNVAKACGHLAAANQLVGDYAAARTYAERALDLLEKNGSEPPEVGDAAHALASIDLAVGDYESARAGFERALGIWEKAYGRDDEHVARALESLGNTEDQLGDLPRAKGHLEEALAIQERRGLNDPAVASSLYDLASVEQRLAHVEAARRMLERAVAIREAKIGPESPQTAMALVRLGEVNAQSARPGPAQELLQRAVAIEEKTLGPQHPELAAALASLASVQLFVGDTDTAFETALRAERIGREHLALTARVLPERQAMRYEAVRASGSSLALTIAARYPSPDRSRDAWDAVIRSRAIVLDELASRFRSAPSQDPAIDELVERLRTARERLARLAVRDPAQSQGDADIRALEEARVEEENAERELAARSTPFRREQEARQRGFEQITSVLPWRSALVGFVSYTQMAEGPTDRSLDLLAFVLRGGERTPATIALGSCAAVDSTARRWNAALARSIAEPTAANIAEERMAGVALRRLLWDPLEVAIGDVERVFFVPDGAVPLIGFAALPVGERGFLIERIPSLHYLGSERDLCADVAAAEVGRGLLVLDAPDFERARRPEEKLGIGTAIARPLGFRGALPDCAEFAELRFDALPGARKEGEAVVTAWQSAGGWRRLLRRDANSVEHLSGPDADEAAFKEHAPGHRVVHLATHGFVLDPVCVTKSGGVRTGGAFAENPLLRSGLALAGANARASAPAGEEDGILTAEEIASLDLSGVEWAVLSECESGTADTEAVLGLCRAFRVAGAHTLLLSLWPVEDDAARRWMRELYQARLARGRSTDRAVAEASLYCLKRLRDRGRYPHPYLWASFAAAGDWR